MLRRARAEDRLVLLMHREGSRAIGQLERRLPLDVLRIRHPQSRGHGVIGPDEPAASVLEIDGVRDAEEEAVQEVALVEEGVFGGLEAAHVDQREDDAVDRPLHPVREDAEEERAPCPRLHAEELALDRLARREDVPEVVHELRVIHLVGERRDRAPDVVDDEVERLGDLGRELPDSELRIEEDRADLGAGQEVVHVVRQERQLRDLPLVLGVDRVELLVDALELLVRALQLFVRGLELLVRSLELFVGALQLLDRGLQVLLRVTELRLERGDLLARDLIQIDLGLRLRGGGRCVPLHRLEQDEEMRRAAGAPLVAPDGHPEHRRVSPRPGADPFEDDRRRLMERAFEPADEDHSELRVDQVEHVEPLPPVARAEEAARSAEGMNELAPVVDEEARRHHFVEERVVRPEELGDGVAPARRGERSDYRARRRLQTRLGRDAMVAALLVELPVLVDDLEVVSERADRLARPEEEGAAPVEREVEEGQHLLLRGGLQVDEEVAAGDHVHAREGGVFDHVVLGEHDHLPELGDDLEGRAGPEEVARQAVLAHARHRLLVVHAPRRAFERARMHVGGEDLHGPVAELRSELLEEDREGVRLFARGTPRDPDPDRRVRRGGVEELGEKLVLQDGERALVAEEARHADEEIPVEDVELFAIALETLDVLVEVLRPRER